MGNLLIVISILIFIVLGVLGFSFMLHCMIKLAGLEPWANMSYFQFLKSSFGILNTKSDDEPNDEEYQRYLAWRKKRSDALNELQQDALDKERKEPYRASAVVEDCPAPKPIPSGFKDFRCAICDHAEVSHSVYDNGCYKCPLTRRCIKFVERNPNE